VWLKSRYRAGRDNLGSDFFSPCLQKSTRYNRAAGYFSSSALVTWADALPNLVKDNELEIRLLISPDVSRADRERLLSISSTAVEGKNLEQDIIDRYIKKAIAFIDDPSNRELRLDLFGWLLEQGRIQIRFTFSEHEEEAEGIYHEKFGIFQLKEGEKVGFIGSANESLQAHRTNGEFVMAFRSWCPEDVERIDELEMEFDEAWLGQVPGMKVSSIPADALAAFANRCRSKSPNERSPSLTQNRPPLWEHQQEAVDKFLSEKAGLLEMATGTGKTRIALEIARNLIISSKINSFIVSTDGNDLLDQWYEDLLHWRRTDNLWEQVLRHYEGHHDRDAFLMNPQNSCLVVSSSEMAPALSQLDSNTKRSLLVVHDEVHGLGSEGKRKQLEGKYQGITWKMGLSATPERTYDPESNLFIKEAIGPVLYRYELKDAIQDRILCPFEYVPLPYLLTDKDRKRLQNVYVKKAARKREGRPMTDEQVAIDLARVYKTAETKPDLFEDYLDSHSDCLSNSIVFVETKEYGERVLPSIQQRTLRYKTYYSEDEKHYLESFANGELDCLITCHKLSQGIDIPHLENVILFSSAKGKLETIQRIGRCLRVDRTNPGKIAKIVDFCLEELEDDPSSGPDGDRKDWLTKLSGIRPARA